MKRMCRAGACTHAEVRVKRSLDDVRFEVLDDRVAEALRRRTPTERIMAALELNRLVRLRIQGHLRTLHPDWDDGAIQAEIARRMLLDYE